MYTYREIQGIALFELKEKNRFADFVPRFVRGIMRFFPGYSRYPRAVREVVVNENTGGEGRGEKRERKKKLILSSSSFSRSLNNNRSVSLDTESWSAIAGRVGNHGATFRLVLVEFRENIFLDREKERDGTLRLRLGRAWQCNDKTWTEVLAERFPTP